MRNYLTQIFTQMKSKLGAGKKTRMVTLLTVACLLFAAPQGAWAATHTVGPYTATSDNGWKTGFNNSASPYMSITTLNNDASIKNGGDRYLAPQGTNASKNTAYTGTVTFVPASGIYMTHYSFNYFYNGTAETSTFGSHFCSKGEIKVDNVSKSSEYEGSGTISGDLSNSTTISIAVTTPKTPEGSSGFFGMGAWSGKENKVGISNFSFDLKIPEVKQKNELWEETDNSLEKIKTKGDNITKDYTYNVADYKDKNDFKVTLTKTKGSASSTVSATIQSVSNGVLTVRFSYTTASTTNWQEDYSYDLLVESKNTVNTQSFTTHINGSATDQKSANTLAFLISASQKVNTLYTKEQVVASNNTTKEISLSSDNGDVAYFDEYDILHIVGAGSATLRATQDANDEIASADVTLNLSVSRRQVEVAYNPTGSLYTGHLYNNYVTVTNDVNGTCPALSYSLSTNEYIDIDANATVTAKLTPGSTTLHITSAETDEWAAADINQTVVVVKDPAALDVCLTGDVYKDFIKETSFCQKITPDGTIFVTDDNKLCVGEANDRTIFTSTFEIHFIGIPKNLALTYNRPTDGFFEGGGWTGWDAASKEYTLTIQEGNEAGSSWNTLYTTGTVSGATGNTSVNKDLSETTRRIRITYTGVRYVYFSNFCINAKKDFSVPASATITQTASGFTPTQFILEHSMMKTITVTSTNPNFVVTPNPVTNAHGLGYGNGSVQMQVSYIGSDISETTTLNFAGKDQDNANVNKSMTVSLVHPAHYVKGTATVFTGNGKIHIASDNTVPAASAYVGGGGLTGSSATMSTAVLECDHGATAEGDTKTFTLRAIPDDKWFFSEWQDDHGTTLSMDNPYVATAPALSLDNAHPTEYIYRAIFFRGFREAPKFLVNDLNMGETKSGITTQSDLALTGDPSGQPKFFFANDVDIRFEDAPGHTGEAKHFTAGSYNSKTRTFPITFDPKPNQHLTDRTYQAKAIVKAENDEYDEDGNLKPQRRVTEHECLVTVVCHPADPVSFTVPEEIDFGYVENVSQLGAALILTDVENLVGTPTLTLSNDIFTNVLYDPTYTTFALGYEFKPGQEGELTATATVKAQNYDGVEVTSDPITLKVVANKPQFTVNNLSMGSMVSGDEPIHAYLPLGNPHGIDPTQVEITITDAPGHSGESSVFSSTVFDTENNSFYITFAPVGAHVDDKDYQAKATISATNVVGTTSKEVLINATVLTSAPATFDVASSHAFGSLQRNQSEQWEAVLSNIENAGEEVPTIDFVGTNADYFHAGDYNPVNRSFTITFNPLAVTPTCSATAYVTVKNYDGKPTTKTITLTGSCIAAPEASFDVQNADHESVADGSYYFGDFNVGDAATRTLYIVNIQNMKEGTTPTISIAPENIFTSAAYNATTQSFDITFEAELGMETVQNAVAIITVSNNDDVMTTKSVQLSAFVVQAVEYDVRVTDAGGNLIEGGETDWATGLSIANKAANAGCTVTLMRAVTGLTAYQEIKNTFTLDLNGKKLSGKNNGSLIYVNGAGKTLTIKDSKSDGRIENINNAYSGVAYGVNVNAGSLILHSGTIYVKNNGASGRRAIGIQNKVNTEVTVNGGKVEAYGYNDSYGIYQASDKDNNTTFTMNAGEIYVEGYSAIYGICAYGKVNVNGGTITATATYYNCRGISLHASANTTAADCYYGTLNMTGGTINSINTADADGTRYAYGVYFSFDNVGMGDGTATDGTHSNKAAAFGTISNATINVSTLGRYAFGVIAFGSYNSKTNTYDKIKINNSVINSTANYYYAYGVYATGGANKKSTNAEYTATDGTFGATSFANIELTDCEVHATVTKNHTAYGVWATTGSATVYANQYANYAGEYAGGATVTVNSGTYTATTGTQYAYAIGTSARARTTYDPETSVYADKKLGGNAEAVAKLNIHGGTFRATAGTTTARAVSNGGDCTIDGGEFYATSGTSTVDGIYTVSGKLKATGAKIDVTAGTSTAYGVRVDVSDIPINEQAWTGFTYHGDAELNNLDVTVTTSTSTTAYGVFANAKALLYTTANFEARKASAGWSANNYAQWKAVSRLDQSFADYARVVVNGGTYTVNAATTTAYGAFSNTTSVAADKSKAVAAEMTLKNATFNVTTNGTTTAYGVYSNGSTVVDGCKFVVQPKTTTAYGAYVYDGTTTITNTTFDVKGTTTAHGFYVNAAINATHGYDYHGNLDLGEGNDVTVAATAGNTAHVLTLIASKRNIASGTYAGDYANAATAIIRDGKYKATATGTTTYVLNLSAKQVQGAVTAAPSCTIEGGKFWAKADGGTQGVCTSNGVAGNILFKGGVYNINTYLGTFLAPGYDEVPLESGRAEYTEGYRYEVLPAGPHGTYVCQIGTGTKYKTLEEALTAVKSGEVIHMLANYTLPAGDYILPTGATLMVPYKDGTGKGASTAIGSSAVTNTSGTTPYLFRKLTFASGARLTCQGSNTILETCAEQKVNGQYGACVGMPSGAYGQIHLEEGAHIELESGSRLNCWGYITGKGTINVKNGATSLEGFQLGDWCGGSNASTLNNNSDKVFPITHYFYQSIECPITYRPGAKAIGSTHVYAASTVAGQDAVGLVGTSGSMFLMTPEDASKDTWVMKDYDETTDQCIWTINNGASVGNLSINMSAGWVSYNFQSANYDLPITTNMTIVMNYGEMGIGQNSVLLPGSQLIINKEGTAKIDGVSVVAYDVDDWTGTKRYFASYSPTWGTTNPRSSIAVKDAEVFVHGKVNIKSNGGLYTTAGGANVHSTNEDAGEVIYTTAAQSNKTTKYLQQGGTTRVSLTAYPAKLKNGVGIDPAFSESAGTAKGNVWTYYDDKWQSWTQVGCLYKDGYNYYYAKPDALVRVDGDEPNEDDLLYYDYATGDRRFVWDEDCYWWEVDPEPVDEGIYRSKNEDHNGKLNCYEFDEDLECWKIKEITVTFNGEGVSSTNYSVGYGTKPKWFGATPTKSGYVWDGWQINGVGEVYSNNDLPAVTTNTTFTSHFKSNPVLYNITFKNPDGTVLDSRNWEKNSTPSYEGTPTQKATASTTYTWNGSWSPAISAVTAAKEYTAQYSSTTRSYDVTFLNYDNTELTTTSVAYGSTPTYSGTPERIDPTDTYIYTFSGWKNQQTGTTGLSAVNGEQTYVAQYTSKQKYYNIRFMDYNATTLKTGPVERETNPVAPADPTRESDMQYNYTFAGWTPSVVAATANATYTATYTPTLRSYTVKFVNYNGDELQSETLEYGATPSYKGATPTHEDAGLQFIGWDDIMRTVNGNKTYTAQFDISRHTLEIASNNPVYGSVSTSIIIQIPHGSTVVEDGNTFTVNGTTVTTVTATPTPATTQYTYTFTGWENLPAEVTADVDNVTAVFTRTVNTYTVIWADEDGTPIETDLNVPYGTTPTYNGDTPTKAATAQYTYTFEGWDKTISTVTGDITYTAVYGQSINSYAITWLDGNGETLKTEQVEYGQTPAYTGTAPTKTATAQYTYTFNNTWTPAITSVTGAATYTAQFNSTVNNYTLSIAANEDEYGSVDKTSVTVPYGSEVTVSGNTFTVNGTTVTATPTSATTQHTYSFVQWNNLPETVTGDVDNVEAEFSRALRKYTITWNNYNNDLIDQTEVEYGVVPTHGEATRPNTEDNAYVFTGWDPEVVAVTGDATYKATYQEFPLRIVVDGGEDETINANITVNTTIVHTDGNLNVMTGKTLKTTDLILEASESASGEITGAGAVVATNAYFHLTHEGGFKARTWYAVAVPWKVFVPANQVGGVYLKIGNKYERQILGQTYDLIFYDGASRATGKEKSWKYLEHHQVEYPLEEPEMNPGCAYMIYLTSDADTIRFEKRSSASLQTNNLYVSKYPSEIGKTYADWNGIANPATYHAYLNVGSTEGRGQVYNAETKQYELFKMNEHKLIVGQPIFVQPAAAGTVVANSTSYASSVRRRAKAQESLTRYELYLAPSMDIATDEVIVRMSEEKTENEYVVGQDLVKMGVSDIVPQMWIDRYDSKMCINTVAPEEDNTADYPLGIRVPQNGEYDLFLDDEPDSESNLYLTYDGETVWNLSYGPYVASLEKGTNTHYGLRIVKKAPQTTTGIEETTVQNGETIRKVIVNDKVYIIRNGQKYSVTGQKAK